MKSLTLAILYLFITLCTAAQDIHNFSLENTNNQIVSFNDLKGQKFTVLDFWATWCKPCLNAMPNMNMLADSFSTRGVQFIGINVDGPRNWSKVRPLVEVLKINFPVLIDKDLEVMLDLNITAIPTLLVVDAENKIVYSHEGYSLGDERIIGEELSKLLRNVE